MLRTHPKTTFVAGGFIRACVSGENINDVDIFAPSKEVALVLAETLNKNGREKKPHETPNAYSVKLPRGPMVQFIHRWVFTEPADMLASFDFTIARAAIWHDGKDWVSLCDERFYIDLAAKRLIYTVPQRNEDAGGSLLRVLKFYQRGYRIPLNSLGAVIARLVKDVDFTKLEAGREETKELQLGKVLTGLLREVDPNIDPKHLSHLPSEPTPGEDDEEEKAEAASA